MGGYASAIPCLYLCIIQYHIRRHHTIVWPLGLWRLCYLFGILYMWPIGGYLSRGGFLVCTRTGCVVGPTYFQYSWGGVVQSGITLLGRLCAWYDWSCLWGIPTCLYLFLLRLGMVWDTVTRLSLFLKVLVPLESRLECTSPDIYFVWRVKLILLACIVKESHNFSAVLRTVVA